jgi:hypothetical protein
VNPFVRPLVDFPPLAVMLWLVIVVIVLVLTLAVVAPRPFQRDSRSLLEVGVIVSGLLLISPLTEPPYLVLLIIPLVASVIYLQTVTWTRPPFRMAAVALLGLWALELIPRHYTEEFFWRRSHTSSVTADLFVTLAPTHFYILLGTFALQLHVLALASSRPTVVAVRRFIRDCPVLAWEWFKDLEIALKLSGRPTH